MSPEQACGQVVDRRADVWAFGCVLFEMLTGRMAFAGPTISDTLAAVLDREPDWSALPAATPAAVRRLLRRCLEKDAKRRLHDIADARIELDETDVKADEALTSRGRSVWVTAAVLGAAFAGLATWALSRLPPPDTGGSVLRLQLNPPDGGRFGVLVGEQETLALSPDGRSVVFGATVDGRPRLWLRALDNTVARVLPGTEGARQPFWSPDGKSVAFVARGKLQKVDVAGGASFVICDLANLRPFGGAWAPDGRILLGVFGGAIVSVPASGGMPSALATLDSSKGEGAQSWPQVLPGGRFLYWSASSKAEENGAIYLASFEQPGRRVKLVTSDTNALYTLSSEGRGYLLWRLNGALVAQEFDPTIPRLLGEPQPLADAVGASVANAHMGVSVSTTGTLLYAPPAGSQQLTWFDRAGKPLGTLGDPGQYFTFRISPDGKQMAITRVDVGRDLWLFDLDRGTARRRTVDSGGGFSPVWSPNDRALLFVGENVSALYRGDTAGSGPDQRLAPWSTGDWALTDWSRDGRFILNTRNAGETRADIWAVPVTPDGYLAADTTATPYLRTPVNESDGRFSPEPNPRWITYQSDENGRDEIYVRSFPNPGSPHRISTNGGKAPRWGPGGHELFFQSLEDKVMVVSVRLGADSVEVSAPRELFALPAQSVFEVAPDGQRFLALVQDQTSRPLNIIHNWPSLLTRRATAP